MVPCSRSLPAQHRCGGGHCPAKNQQGADEAELGAQQWLTLHQYHHYHTVTEQSCFRENVSSKRDVQLIISIGFTAALTIFMLNMPSSTHTCQDHFSSRALTERAQDR